MAERLRITGGAGSPLQVISNSNDILFDGNYSSLRKWMSGAASVTNGTATISLGKTFDQPPLILGYQVLYESVTLVTWIPIAATLYFLQQASGFVYGTYMQSSRTSLFITNPSYNVQMGAYAPATVYYAVFDNSGEPI